MKKNLTAPLAGERTVLYPPSYGKTLVEQSFLYEGGRTEKYVLWSYEKKPSAIILPLTVDREIVAVRQYRHGISDFVIEFPGGGTPTATKSIEEIATEELLEETGYWAKKVINLGIQTYFEPGNLNAKISLLVGLGCQKNSAAKHDSTEIMETLVVPVMEWYEMITRGEVLDNKTVALSLIALPYLDLQVTAKN